MFISPRKNVIPFFFVCVFLFAPHFSASAATGDAGLPADVRQATVLVQCGERQGSGTIISADGSVLTNAHVVADVELANPTASADCRVGIIDPTTQAVRYTYRATVTRWIFEKTHNQDFAILHIGEATSRTALAKPFPFLKIWEFSEVNDRMWTLGFPGNEGFTIQSGFIQGFGNGFIRTTAVFRPGNSGGTALNAGYNLIGIPARIVTITQDGQAQQIRYELVDIRAVLQWLDMTSPTERDRFFTFADPERSRRSFSFIDQSSLECDYVVRATSVSTVFCLLPDDQRMTFPNEATFRSWYPNFADVDTVPDTSLAEFRLVRNATLRPGTLVKSQTSPEVYVVSDVFGTMRWIPTEERAIELWGANWASLVHDIPDAFFVNYTIGPALPTI